MKKFLKIVLPLVIVGILAAGVYLRINGNAKDGESAEGNPAASDSLSGIATSAADEFATMPIAVEGVPVVLDTLIMMVTAEGQAAAERIDSVKARVQGRVFNVHVRENAGVGDGSVLVVIDSTEYALNLREARANLAQKERQYAEITLGDERLTDAAVRSSRAQAAREKAGIEQGEVAVRRAELELERTRISAPFGGRIADLKVVPGQFVSQGDHVLTVVDVDPIRLEVNVLESAIGYLAPGRGASVVFSALPGETYRGIIETINPLVDQKTRTARVTVRVPNPQGRILPGFYAKVQLDAERLPNRILVPKEAIIERDRRTLVFLFEGEGDTGTAMWQYVRAGRENGVMVEIIEDPDDSATRLLKPGEVVLTDGHYTLTHGAAVRLVSNSGESEGGRPR
jgi:HlyD family secretion protein